MVRCKNISADSVKRVLYTATCSLLFWLVNSRRIYIRVREVFFIERMAKGAKTYCINTILF